jgi:hypothetical protein
VISPFFIGTLKSTLVERAESARKGEKAWGEQRQRVRESLMRVREQRAESSREFERVREREFERERAERKSRAASSRERVQERRVQERERKRERERAEENKFNESTRVRE